VFGADTRRTDLDSNLPRLARTFINFNGSPRPCPEQRRRMSKWRTRDFLFFADDGPAVDPAAGGPGGSRRGKQFPVDAEC